MHALSRTIAVALSAGGLCGCLPFPHQETVIPPLTGQVSRSGTPVAGAEVLLGEGYVSCKKTSRAALTDSAGRFSYPGASKTRFLSVVSDGEPHVDVTVCIAYGGRTWVGSYWVGAGPARVECDSRQGAAQRRPGYA